MSSIAMVQLILLYYNLPIKAIACCRKIAKNVRFLYTHLIIEGRFVGVNWLIRRNDEKNTNKKTKLLGTVSFHRKKGRTHPCTWGAHFHLYSWAENVSSLVANQWAIMRAVNQVQGDGAEVG